MDFTPRSKEWKAQDKRHCRIGVEDSSETKWLIEETGQPLTV
jgi:hypothetical protein